jgi:hypothetical protein
MLLIYVCKNIGGVFEKKNLNPFGLLISKK